jgi:zinc transporter, ZIP family
VLASPILAALVASLLAGAGATAVGALPALVLPSISERTRAILGGLSGGIMLAATFFSLLGPGLEAATARWDRWGGLLVATAGLVAGAALVATLHRYSPHEHFIKGPEGADRTRLSRAWLFVIAITLHNFPEGLAVGVGAASGELDIALPITLGIGLQNVPEGLVVALSLLREGYARDRAVLVGCATGLVEPIGALIGAAALALSAALLPAALCFAAGAMLFVISDEVIPESHQGPHAGVATWGLIAGFVLMMVLDVAFAA